MDDVERAVARIRDLTGFEPGAEVSTAEVLSALGVTETPERRDGESDVRFARRAQKHRLTGVGPVNALKDQLLRVWRVDLRPTHRGSYQIVPPGQQATIAARDGYRAARKALVQAQARITHVNVDRLTADERLAREESILGNSARIASISHRKITTVLRGVRKAAEAAEAERQESDPPMRPVTLGE